VKLLDEDANAKPYAWISQTAPASPLGFRSRAGSIVHEDDESLFDSGIIFTKLGIRHFAICLFDIC